MKKNVTLKFLSEKLDLNISTVSRILNGSISNSKVASDETIRIVRKMAKKYDYKPNPYAISLKTNKSNMVGFLVPNITDIVLASIYEGIDHIAVDNNMFTFVSNTRDNIDMQVEIIKNAIARYVDGLIIGDYHTNEENEYLKLLEKKKIPFVLTNRHNNNYSSITCNDMVGGQLVADHLLSKNHKHFGVLAGLSFASTGKDRATGFIQTCLSNEVKISKNNIINSPFDSNSGYESGIKLLSRKPFPTAVFAVNDFLAIGFMGAMKKHNLIPGQDIDVVGYNDISLASKLQVPLTTIQSPMKEMGAYAMKLLIEKINGKEVSSISLNPRLIVRESG